MKRPPAKNTARRMHLVSRSALVSRSRSRRLSALPSWARSTLRQSPGFMSSRTRTGTDRSADELTAEESGMDAGAGTLKTSGAKQVFNCQSEERFMGTGFLGLLAAQGLRRLLLAF